MILFVLPVRAEVINLVNFFLADMILLALAIVLTSRLAGLTNYWKFARGETVALRICRFPHVGGGIIMNRGRLQTCLIILRASMVIAICIGSFGIQGRSISKPEMMSVRQPGSVSNLSAAAVSRITHVYSSCAQVVDGELVFGRVQGESCFTDLSTESVYVKTLSLTYEKRVHRVKNCTSRVPSPNEPVTVFDCQESNFSCFGTFSPHFPSVQYETCTGVVYENSSAYYCPAKGFNPSNSEEQTADCRKMGVVRQDVEQWVDLFFFVTPSFLEAIFGSAYAVEGRAEVPGAKRAVTEITLWWLVPTLWQLAVVLILYIWHSSLQRSGAYPIAHDEFALTQMLKKNSRWAKDDSSLTATVAWV